MSAAGNEGTDDYPAGSLDPAIPDRFPRNPAALRTALLAYKNMGAACPPDPSQQTPCLMTAVRDLYSQYVIPPDLAAAIWTVLADQPDLKYLGTTTDRAGRAAKGIAYQIATQDAAIVTVLLIDPEDGQLIGTETVTLKDPALGVDRPTVTGFETYTARAWVANIGDMA
jgi:hypothetical protein